MEASGKCPYCGERITFLIDEGGGEFQTYTEDCEVCCRPIEVSFVVNEEGRQRLKLRRQDE